MFDNIPSLKVPFYYRIWEMIVAALFFFPAVLIQGATVIWITEDLEVDFLPAKYVELDAVDEDGNPISGMATKHGFIEDDGPGSYLTLWRTRFAIGFEDIHALLNPAAFEGVEDVEPKDLQPMTDGGEDGERQRENLPGVHVAVTENAPKRLRGWLAFPFFFFGTVFYGSSLAFKLTDNGRLGFKMCAETKDPEHGYAVGKEFKRLKNRGTVFSRWNVDMIFAMEGVESVLNPAMPEALRSKEELERRSEKTVGAKSNEVRGTLARAMTLVNHGRLADYSPFAMLDGTTTRTQMNFAYEARVKHEDKNDLLYLGGLIMAFFVGALTPRLNGTTGGGGGGISIPLPQIAPPVELVGLVLDTGIMVF